MLATLRCAEVHTAHLGIKNKVLNTLLQDYSYANSR